MSLTLRISKEAHNVGAPCLTKSRLSWESKVVLPACMVKGRLVNVLENVSKDVEEGV